ncbi:MAG TPA: STAS domain-containing protein [Candidatus Acidoferrales bacterium]|nr:STAS domain-containing protein [Candidatus Acidoferrales bacterium]
MQLKISSRQSGDVTVVDLEGRVVIGRENDALNEQLEKMARGGGKKLLVNLAKVTQLDSSGICTLVRGLTTAKNSEGVFKIVHAGGKVQEVLEVMHLTRAIPTFDDEAKAVASFSTTADSAPG